MDLTSRRSTKMIPTPSRLDHSKPAICDHFSYVSKYHIFGSLDHMIVANYFNQTFKHVEFAGLEDLAYDLRHVESLRMIINVNFDISRSLSY